MTQVVPRLSDRNDWYLFFSLVYQAVSVIPDKMRIIALLVWYLTSACQSIQEVNGFGVRVPTSVPILPCPGLKLTPQAPSEVPPLTMA